MPTSHTLPTGNASVETLLHTPQDLKEQTLATRYAPVIRFDDREPFLPLAVGYTIFRADADSPSFPRHIELNPPDRPQAVLAIEYAIWWDWDIGHLYELEHIWVYVNSAGCVVRGEASWHGGFHDMAQDGKLSLEDDHLVVVSEPGKHAFAPNDTWYAERRQQDIRFQTTRWAGAEGVWVTPLFAQKLKNLRTPFNNSLVRTYLQRQAFDPAWTFSHRFAISNNILIPWGVLQTWIPGRVAQWVAKLTDEIKPAELRFLRIAHRGASAHAPENTLTAFRKAAELNADAVELDVQVSADGVPVISHNLAVNRRQNSTGLVKDLTLAQLKALDAGHGEHIPTLEEAIECCQTEGLGMYIELKADAAIRPVVAAIQHHHIQQAVIVCSFRADWVAGVKLLAPDILTSVLFGAPNVDPVKLAQAVGADYVHPCWESLVPHPHTLLTPEWVARVHQAGLGIILWHEERPEEIAALSRLGVDGICSNAPELLLPQTL